MEIQIAGKNLELSPAIRTYINRKMEKINRHLSNILSFEVVAAEEQTRAPESRFILQVTINTNGTLLRGEERGQDLYTATDKAAEVMNRQIEHYKGKVSISKGKTTLSIRTNTTEVKSGIEAEYIDNEPKIVKTKRFDVKPMSLEEAVDQMVLLNHDFFLFFNPDSNNMNLLYKRKDGNYGLIEPTTK
jgi:putative sigma-54 modulation protein